MPGIPGRGGPPPKKPSQRRRRNAPAVPTEKVAVDGTTKVPVPRADPKWHPVAKRLYRSLAQSGQVIFYQPSDWATAYVLAESISRELSPQPIVDKEGQVTMVSLPPKAAAMTAWLKALHSLLGTEGARRLARVELERPEPPAADEAEVTWLDDARRRLEAGDIPRPPDAGGPVRRSVHAPPEDPPA